MLPSYGTIPENNALLSHSHARVHLEGELSPAQAEPQGLPKAFMSRTSARVR
jgi:hypothetical protein